MQIKKTLCLLLCLTMLVGMLVGCSGQETPDPGISTPSVSDTPSVTDNPPEDSTPPKENDPPIDHEALVDALDVDEKIKPELVRASKAGLPIDYVGKNTISGTEFAVLLDRFVELVAPERIDEWQKQYPTVRTFNDKLTRLNAMACLYLAANFEGEGYANVTMWPWTFANSLNVDWDACVLDGVLLGTANNGPYYNPGVGGGMMYLDGAAYAFFCGRMSRISGKICFDYDSESNSLRLEEDLTGTEAVLAVIRLLESAYEYEPETIEADMLDKAVELGIVDSTLADRANDAITRAELIDIITRIHNARYGTESKFLTDASGIMPDAEASRLWFAVSVFFSEMEYHMGIPYDSPEQLGEYIESTESNYKSPGASFVGLRPDGTAGEVDVWVVTWGSKLDGIDTTAGFDAACSFVCAAPDRTTGEKVMSLNGLPSTDFRPDDIMTVADAIAAAVRYYNYTEPQTLVDCDEMTDYDHSIITDALLAKETSLPDASCAYLPAEWRGAMLTDMMFVHPQMLDQKADKIILEGDLDVVKEAGFNFIGVSLDFSWLQGMHGEHGKFSEERLRTIDRIIAMCIERDIHIDLRVTGVGDLAYTAPSDDWLAHNDNALHGTDHIESFAGYWGALARRYKDIPNKHLSFNLLTEPDVYSEEEYARFFTPAVEAIREHSPDRCIIADIHSGQLTGESMAKLGVALSYHQYDPRDFCVLTNEQSSDSEYIASVKWPYNGKDIESTMFERLGGGGLTSVGELQQLAKQYGVGMMVGEIGVFVDSPGCLARVRYSDETTEAYFMDIADTYAKYGIGWCTGAYKEYGVLNHYPAVAGVTYTNRDNTDNYVDEDMLAMWKRINGIK